MGMEETNFVYSTCTFMIPGADVLVQEHGLDKNGHIGHSGKNRIISFKIVIDTSGYIVYNLIYTCVDMMSKKTYTKV